MKIKILNNLSGYALILFAIFFIGLLLRIVMLSTNPSGFTRDEAYLGYNAYSVLETGRDISGNFLPLFIESFLYTPAGYIYATIPFIKLFGLSIESVRMASAIFGAFTIPLIYFLTKEVFRNEKKVLSDMSINTVSIISAGLMALSPWHINLSRTASVSTLVTFFVIGGVLLLFMYLRMGRMRIILGAFLLFFVSLSFYIAPYSFLPFLLLGFLLVYFHKIPSKKIYIFLTILLTIPILLVYANKNLSLRVNSLSLVNSPIVSIMLSENASDDGVNNIGSVVTRSMHNKVTVIGGLFLSNYFQHLSYDFFFTDKSFPERFRVPEVGLLQLILLPLMIAGFLYLYKKESKVVIFLILWILASPFGSSLANDDVPNMQRTLFMLPPILLIVSVGVFSIFAVKKRHLPIYISILLVGVYLYQCIFSVHQYLVHEKSYRPWYRHDGYMQLASTLSELEPRYSKIVVTNRESAPTIFLSFFLKYDPDNLQKAIDESGIKDTDRVSFGKYEISQEECPVRMMQDTATGNTNLIGDKKVLYVNSGNCEVDELGGKVNFVDKIIRGDGSVAFYVLEVK